MRAQIVPDAVSEDCWTDVLLQHPQYRCALFIGQDVEHRVGVLGGLHRIFDRSRTPESIY